MAPEWNRLSPLWTVLLIVIAAEAWRTLGGQGVLLDLIGRPAGGESVHVVCATRYVEFTRSGGVEIDPGRSTPIELDALRGVAETGEGQA